MAVPNSDARQAVSATEQSPLAGVWELMAATEALVRNDALSLLGSDNAHALFRRLSFELLRVLAARPDLCLTGLRRDAMWEGRVRLPNEIHGTAIFRELSILDRTFRMTPALGRHVYFDAVRVETLTVSENIKTSEPAGARPTASVGRPNTAVIACGLFKSRRDRGVPLGTQIEEARGIISEWPSGAPAAPIPSTVSQRISVLFKAYKQRHQ